MMRLLVFGLTFLAVALFINQYFGQKGTKSHITRGSLVGFLSMAVVLINTLEISIKKGLVWDMPFLVHTGLGTLFFVSLALTSRFGYLLKNKRNENLINKHRIAANTSALLLFLTLTAAIILKFFR